MARLIIFLLVTLMISTTAIGQQTKCWVGIEGGPNRISLRGNDYIKNDHQARITFLGGVFFQYDMTNHFSLRTNLAFERKGSVFKGQIAYRNPLGGVAEVEDATIYNNYDYLTVPLLLRYTLGEEVKGFVNFGPYLGFLLRSGVSGKKPKREPMYDTETSERLDLGFSAGVGVQVPIMERVSLSCELRNNLGLINMSKVSVVNEGTIKSNTTNLLIGIAYHL